MGNGNTSTMPICVEKVIGRVGHHCWKRACVRGIKSPKIEVFGGNHERDSSPSISQIVFYFILLTNYS
jgi:hypothetical protein